MPPSLTLSPTVLTLHLPPKTLVGIDLITFTSTPYFHGIRDLPRGWHFLYTGATESLSLRSGGWFYADGASVAEKNASIRDKAVAASRLPQSRGVEVLVWKWDTESETLTPLKGDSDATKQEAMRYKANLGSVWQSGGLFRYRSRILAPISSSERAADDYDEMSEEENRAGWERLTDYLSPKLLSRIVGQPDTDIDGQPCWMVSSASTASRDTEHIPGLLGSGQSCAGMPSGGVDGEFFFLPIDLKRTWREGAIGRERTEAAQDRSWALGNIINEYSHTETPMDRERPGEAQILGELQFTFLMALTLLNHSCLQQWKRLMNLLLTCRNAIVDREWLLANVLRLLLLQLKRCDDLEGGFFELDSDDVGEFIRKLLLGFGKSVRDVVGDTESAVKSELTALEDWVANEFDWDLRPVSFVRRGMLQLEDGEEVEMELSDNADEETGEYAPVVVDMDETLGNADMKDTLR